MVVVPLLAQVLGAPVGMTSPMVGSVDSWVCPLLAFSVPGLGPRAGSCAWPLGLVLGFHPPLRCCGFLLPCSWLLITVETTPLVIFSCARLLFSSSGWVTGVVRWHRFGRAASLPMVPTIGVYKRCGWDFPRSGFAWGLSPR